MALYKVIIISYIADIQFNGNNGELGSKVAISQVKRKE
jgi:hypothetical protein